MARRFLISSSFRRLRNGLCGFILTIAGATTVAMATTVDFVLLSEQNPSAVITGRKWADMLSGLGSGGIQVRAPQPGEKVAIAVGGTKSTPTYHITARLDNGQLVVPGGQFTLGDRAKLAKWIAELGENGVAGVTEKKAAFGLLPQQLAELKDDLAKPVGFEIKGMPAKQAVEKIATQLKFKLSIDPEVEKALVADDAVRDELKELACGTALAAIARPAGAVLQPQKPAGGEMQYVLIKATAGVESWPIGWPLDKGEGRVLPTLLDSLNVELKGVSVATTLAALQPRLKAPMLFDHNSIVKNRIDLSKNITLPPKKMLYATALNQVLFQGGLKYSVRVDDAGSPLIWITSQK